MVKLRTHTPFAGAAFKKYNARQELTVTVTVVASFRLTAEQRLEPLKAQPEIRLADTYDVDDDCGSQLVEVSDFVPFRPTTNIVVLGKARALDAKPLRSWPVSIKVGDVHEKLVVHGPRHWFRGRNRHWQLSEAQPVTDVPLDWRLSAGGRYVVGDQHPQHGEVDIWNPTGVGIILAEETPAEYTYAAPQIEGADAPITQPSADITPRNMAPIPAVWRFREQYAGSYDQTWLETQHPFLPADFDPAFYNVAPPPLQTAQYLRGDERVTLTGMDADRARVDFALPGRVFGAVVTHDNGLTVRQPLNLDLVELDWRYTERVVRLAWRSAFPWRDGIKIADLGELSFESLHPPLGTPQDATG